jgi:hypothetical protein
MALLALVGGAVSAQPTVDVPLPAPLGGVAAIAWLGSWAALRAPAVPAPTATGQAVGDLERAFRVEWTRHGQALRLKATKLEEAWVGRLALELRFAGDTAALTYGYNDLPVRIPLAAAGTGQVLWAWEYSVPSWLLGENGKGTGGVSVASTNSHGFFIDRAADGTVLVHVAVDWPKAAGESVEMSFRLLTAGETPAALQAERRQRLGAEVDPDPDRARAERLKAEGFVRVNAAGTGFEDAAGKPLRILGMNTPHLASLSPAEQEKVLAPAAAAGITVTRLLIPDYAYRPLGAWSGDAYGRLLATVDRCAAHGIRTVVCLEFSGCGGHYNETSRRSPNWSDLYLLPEMLELYRGTVERVVTPLRDNPAVFGFNVTNEPDLALSPASPTLLTAWRAWLATTYGTTAALQTAWGQADLAGFEAAELPRQEDYDAQRTRPAQDFVAFNGAAVGQSMIRRAQWVRQADARHLLTVSAWNPRLLRGLQGAEVFDYWAPHSYEIYFVGPEISEQVAYQVGLLRWALPDRPRPVVIEEFGLFEDPKFPERLRAEHCGAFLEAGERWGAGMMLWYDLTPGLLAEFAQASRRETPATSATPGPELGYYVPPSAESRVSVYPLYMWRRWWGRALATAQTAGFRVREVCTPAAAQGCKALLVLAADLTPAEVDAVRAFGLPPLLPEGAAAAQARLPEAVVLPSAAAEQAATWAAWLRPRP